MKLVPAMLAALAGAVALIVQWAGNRPLWVDEQMIALNIRDRSLAELAAPLSMGQSAPLGWLAAQRAMVIAGGAGDQLLRLVPVLFGIATLIAAAWVARRWMTAAGGFVFTLLCASGLWISFFSLELKHYSADVFFGLMIPAAAAWVLEAASVPALRRRAVIWWLAAAAGHWLSNGGLFVAPGCTLVLFGVIARRHGIREAIVFASGGLLWLASFAIYYQLSLTHTHNNTFLRNFWIREVAPRGAGMQEIAAWIAGRFRPLAGNPAGTGMWLMLWICALGGFALARRRVLAALFATAPLTAFVLGVTGFVPLWERFALWMVPALYAGIAMLADRALLLARQTTPPRAYARRAAAVVMLLAAAVLTIDVAARGVADMRESRPAHMNHGLDDRGSIAWLLAQRRSGDAILTTRLGWPAVWWYSGMRPAAASAPQEDLLEVGHRFPGADCRPEQLQDTLRPFTRALLHVGFPDKPEGYGALLLRHLDQIGAIAHYRQWGDEGFTAIVELHTPNASESTMALLPPPPRDSVRLAGCISVSPATLW